MKKGKIKKSAKVLIILGAAVLALIAVFVIINLVVIDSSAKYVYNINDINSLPKVDCILVPGALVYDNDSLSAVLQDRVDYAIKVYKAGKADRLLFSGDHGRKDYDEVNAMMNYAVSKGVPKEAIFLDHAGFSTYESMYRARDIFQVKSVIIASQKFHISRCIYIARCLGLEAYGINSTARIYRNELSDNSRESLARIKDFFSVNIFHPKPTYLGDAIPIFGDSSLTHDKG